MASHRTTIILTDKERRAAKRLAARWGVTPSEAIRRAVRDADERDEGAEQERLRKKRIANLEALFKAFEGVTREQVEEELRQRREERDNW